MTPWLFRRPTGFIYFALAISLILLQGYGHRFLQLVRLSRTTPASSCGRQTDFPWELASTYCVTVLAFCQWLFTVAFAKRRTCVGRLLHRLPVRTFNRKKFVKQPLDTRCIN